MTPSIKKNIKIFALSKLMGSHKWYLYQLIKLVPKPKTKTPYCHICKEHYEDYSDVFFELLSIYNLKAIKRVSIQTSFLNT